MIVFDLETQNLAAEVGGWHHKNLLRLAVACTYDDRLGYQLWWEAQAVDLIRELQKADMIVGFNVRDFDFEVLSFYGDVRGLNEKSFDILGEIRDQGKRRVSLNRVANLNLGEAKKYESGVTAVQLWRAGRLEELATYCEGDVELTKRLFEYWEFNGLLWISGSDYVVWPGTSHLMGDK